MDGDSYFVLFFSLVRFFLVFFLIVARTYVDYVHLIFSLMVKCGGRAKREIAHHLQFIYVCVRACVRVWILFVVIIYYMHTYECIWT